MPSPLTEPENLLIRDDRHLPALAAVIGLALSASSAQAAYAQMGLDGLAADILLAVLGLYMIAVDGALLLKAFRSKAFVLVNTIISLALVALLIAFSTSLGSVFRNLAQDWQVNLPGALIVLVPSFIVVAPLVQYRALLRQGSLRGIYVAVALQRVGDACGAAHDKARPKASSTA